MSEWQPIETAAKVEKPIVGCYVMGGYATAVIVWWSHLDNAWETYNRKSPPVTHWMPLPPPPTKD